jgi:N-acetylglucosamine-6-phosphate deacetylase
MRTLIKNGSVILPSGIEKKHLILEDGIIQSITSEIPYADQVIDAAGLFVSPGFIDIHLHGGAGHDFMEGTTDAFYAISEYHLAQGTTSIVPTAISAPIAGQIRFLSGYQAAEQSGKMRARMLGAHLEGPYLSEQKKGAHPREFLKNPNPFEYQRLIADYPFIKRFTIAPELEGAYQMGDYLHDHQINASIGHSLAYGRQIIEAKQHGFTSVTHLFNAMNAFGEFEGKKAAGIMEMTLLDSDLYAELILDLVHVPRELVQLAYRNKTADRLILVSDCLSPAGVQNDSCFIGDELNGFKVDVRDAAYLAGTHTLAGSIASCNSLVRNAIKVGISLIDAIKMVTITPATLLGEEKTLGSIVCGKVADLVLFDQNINMKQVFVKGQKII